MPRSQMTYSIRLKWKAKRKQIDGYFLIFSRTNTNTNTSRSKHANNNKINRITIRDRVRLMHVYRKCNKTLRKVNKWNIKCKPHTDRKLHYNHHLYKWSSSRIRKLNSKLHTCGCRFEMLMCCRFVIVNVGDFKPIRTVLVDCVLFGEIQTANAELMH